MDLNPGYLAIVGSWVVVLVVLERRFGYARQKLFRTGFVTDVFWYTIVQSLWLGPVISALILWVDGVSGLSRLRVVSDWPVLAQALFFLVLHDLYIYWFHRWQHNNRYLWRLHEAHHSVRDVDWVAGSRSHPLEIVINQTIEFAPIVLLGAHPVIPLFKVTIDALWGMWIHANVDVRTGPLQYVINGPEMHRWHHAEDVAPPGCNYATKLAFWDWIFGTAYLPRGRKPRAYGLGEGAIFPENYFLQLAYAFRPKEKEPAPVAGGKEPAGAISEG